MEYDEKTLYSHIASMCEKAGEPEGAADVFYSNIVNSPELIKEFEYYAENRDFLCEYKVSGLSVADILVWQVDRFKAALDEGKFELKYNGPHMVLAAFNTMCDVEKNPSRYLQRFRAESGSDYPGKGASNFE